MKPIQLHLIVESTDNVSAQSMSFIFTTFAFGLSTLSWCTPLRTGLFLWIESI